MGTHTLGSFLVCLAVVVVLVLAWAAIQGIGAAFGSGVQEWLVR